MPDLLVISPFGVFFLEVKTATGRLSELQKATIDRMRAAGANVYVVRTTEAVGEILADLEAKHCNNPTRP